MGLVFGFLFAFFGIILCTGCSVKNNISNKLYDMTQTEIAESEANKRKAFEKKFVMSYIEEERLYEDIFSEERIQHTFNTCKVFLDTIKGCDIFFSDGINGFEIIASSKFYRRIIARIMAAESGKILYSDFLRLEHNAATLGAVRLYAMDSRILQLVDKKLMSFGVPPMVYTQGGSDGVWWRLDNKDKLSHEYYTLKPVQEVKEFYDYVEDYSMNGSFKWLNSGKYSSGEERYAGIRSY